MKDIYGISFSAAGKTYYFYSKELSLVENICVIVETEKGLQYGKVVELNVDVKNKDILSNLKPIIRIATENDYDKYLKNLKDSKKALDLARKRALKLNLDMNFVDATFTFDRKQLTLNFIADERIDFRELVKFLASTYKTRIELHQLGVRDKAKMFGGIGCCGRELCCHKFLNKIDAISINMAKNQNIALNPSKINGLCGRLLCCLQYEDDVYCELRKGLPSIGDKVKTEFGQGEVVDLNILNRSCTVLVNGEKKEISYGESKK